MSNAEIKKVTDHRGRNYYLSTDEEVREFSDYQHKIEREINKAAEAGLFLTAADLNE